MKSESPYHPMAQDSLEDLALLKTDSGRDPRSDDTCQQSVEYRRKARRLTIGLALSALINLALLWIGIALWMHRGPANPIFPQFFYCKLDVRLFYVSKLISFFSSCSASHRIQASCVPRGLWPRSQYIPDGSLARGRCRLGGFIPVYVSRTMSMNILLTVVDIS